ncbi:metallophosphoesterase [Haloplanus halobius]|uniref:metallophosphoesterase n=1 Tax=Haloplanus halobius TaxID=2934938 RepID=UPI002010BDBE|nr:metallophosphoesterase [Haloplanus sp. XH21]
MALVEPVPDAPAATADCGDERALVVADYHAGIEVGLRYERGVELRSAADTRRERLLALCERVEADRVVVLGDLVHRIGDPGTGERDEVDALLDALDARGVPLTLVPGNHDGGVADAYGDRMEVADPEGHRRGDVGFVHGHTWPNRAVLGAETVCMGHEHPQVRLEDEVGVGRAEKAWLRGDLRLAPFADHLGVGPEALAWSTPDLVVFPAFNDRSGGTWINVENQEFLSPFLPDALGGGEAYLLDGTRLGAYRRA